MSKRYLVTRPDGGLSVIQIVGMDPLGDKLAKTLFELSRGPSDINGHFNPATHTLETLEAGIPGHFPISYRVCEEEDLPEQRSSRDAWEDTGVIVQVKRTGARTN